jgi:hypothetical protein
MISCWVAQTGAVVAKRPRVKLWLMECVVGFNRDRKDRRSSREIRRGRGGVLDEREYWRKAPALGAYVV